MKKGKTIVYEDFLQGYRRFSGKNALRFNVLAVKTLRELIRPMFGPLGRDKLLVDEDGIATLTKDGFLMLDNLSSFHPLVDFTKENIESLKETVGDGTISTVLLFSELLDKAEKLIFRGIPRAKILKGFSLAYEESLKILEDFSRNFDALDIKNEELIRKITLTVLRGSGLTEEEIKESCLCDLIRDTVYKVVDMSSLKKHLNIDDVKVVGLKQGSLKDSKVVDGIVLKPVLDLPPNSPKKVLNPKIALINTPIESEKLVSKTRIEVTDPTALAKLKKQEKDSAKKVVEKIRRSGVNVVFCSRRIDDLPMAYFIESGILAVRNVSKTDMKRLEKITGGKTVTILDELNESSLGKAEFVEEQRFNGAKRIVVKCKNSKAVTILLLGATKRATVATRKTLRVLSAAIKNPKIVVGGGAVEIEIAQKLKSYSLKFNGKEQIAIQAFAEALESIPQFLAENAGERAVDVLIKLRELHNKGVSSAYFNVLKRKVVEKTDEPLEPLEVKKQTLTLAYEMASFVLSIDEVLINEEVLK